MSDSTRTSSLSRRQRRAVLATGAATIALLGLGSGKAFAYFTNTGGTGSGTASVSSQGAKDITLSTTSTTGTALYPGGSGDLIISASNPNSSTVTVTNFSIGSVSGCTTPALSLNTTSFTVPAGTHTITLPNALSMGTGASNDCQGATLTLTLSIPSGDVRL